jgi:hypothetical protein
VLTGPVRGALEGEGPYAGKVYFFQGGQYWRYDLKSKDYGEVDYPRPLTAWKLPPEFVTGIDACLSGRGRYAGKAYFFKDGWYVSYDWKTSAVSEKRLVARWDQAHVFPFASGFDAALNGRGPLEGKAYFFKGATYARYDWDQDRIDLIDQKVSAWHLGPGFESDIAACLSVEGDWRTPHVAYFFKGNDYVKYSWKEDRALPGYPLAIAAGWPTGCAVWASHSQAPTNVCPDPRLERGRARIAYPAGTLSGQAGWQATLSFTTIEMLANKLAALTIPGYYGDDQAGSAAIPRGRITRLAMNAHGLAGIFAANGPNASEPSQWLTDMLVRKNPLRSNLERVASLLATSAPVLLLGCNSGQGSTGGYLLMSLSEVFKGHPVTGMVTIGYAGGPNSAREKEGCSEAGMRDTGFFNSSSSPNEENDRVAQNWNDLRAWPWASEFSPHAKTALNGELTRRPEADLK